MTQTSSADHSTIHIAEDNEILRLNLPKILAEHGYTVVEADNAEYALKPMAERKDIRWLFTDIQMPPGCNGLELAREVHDRWTKVLLVITSRQAQHARAEIADDGRFIQKPYSAKELLGQVDELIKKDDVGSSQ